MDEKKRIHQKWSELFLAKYPVKPAIEVVDYIDEATGKIVEGVFRLYAGEDADVEDAIDDLMRFLATDGDMSPGESLRLFGTLKRIMAGELKLNDTERIKLYDIIDSMIYRAFDLYMASREEIYKLRIKEKERDIEIMRRIIEFAERSDSKP
jgi:hypothetical protein